MNLVPPAVFRRAFAPGGDLEVFGRAEAARELGVATQNLTSLKGLPEPLFRLGAGRSQRTFWLASEVRALAACRQRR